MVLDTVVNQPDFQEVAVIVNNYNGSSSLQDSVL
jgi:hypothetical protein